MKIRIPSWTTSEAAITVDGEQVFPPGSLEPGTYATVPLPVPLSRSGGDTATATATATVTVRLPMRLRLLPAADDAGVAALAFGPTVLAGDYGDAKLSANPALDLGSVRRVGDSGLAFTGTTTATTGTTTVDIAPFYDAHGYNYVVYWAVSGELPSA